MLILQDMLAKTHDNSERSQVPPGSAATESIAEEVESAVSNPPLMTEQMAHIVLVLMLLLSIGSVGVQVVPADRKNANVQVKPKLVTRSVVKWMNNKLL